MTRYEKLIRLAEERENQAVELYKDGFTELSKSAKRIAQRLRNVALSLTIGQANDSYAGRL